METGQSNSPKQSRKNKREWEKSEDSIWDFEDNIKRTNIHSTGVPEGRERGGTKNILEEIMAEKFLIWGKKDIQISASH